MDLSIGIVSQGTVYDELLCEMLDQQGLAYRVIGRAGEPRKYPIVMLSKYSEDAYSLALRSCESESGVIVAERFVSFDVALSLLSGALTDGRDDFGLEVDEEEEKLLSAVKARLFGTPLLPETPARPQVVLARRSESRLRTHSRR